MEEREKVEEDESVGGHGAGGGLERQTMDMFNDLSESSLINV